MQRVSSQPPKPHKERLNESLDKILAEPLSQRKHEIMALLAEDQSNQEIAEALTLAESSVKGFTQHSYSKLRMNDWH